MTSDLLGNIARVCRSKNAGIALVTLDVLLPDEDTYARAVRALTRSKLSALYNVRPEDLQIIHWPAMKAIKVTLPRWTLCGSPGDRDVYGCQQHLPLWNIPLD